MTINIYKPWGNYTVFCPPTILIACLTVLITVLEFAEPCALITGFLAPSITAPPMLLKSILVISSPTALLR